MREQRLLWRRLVLRQRRALRWLHEHWPRLLAVGLIAAALWPLAGRGNAVEGTAPAAHEWPHEIDGAPLRPLALSAVEQRFAQRFPGHIGRFEADGAVWVLRDVTRPTRALHPAADCFRGLGYRIADARLQLDAHARLRRCFAAERGDERVRVCERIVDAGGESFVDASSWFWAATLGHSHGPWRALTQVEAM
jgi:hypothetical protein